MLQILRQLNFKKYSKRDLYAATNNRIDPIQEASLSENCILVDENDNELGPVSKKDCHAVCKDGSVLLHRAFSVFIFNSKNEILLQQRSPTKITYPYYFTNACCSHPLYDIENERNGIFGAKLAAQRRLNYELGIPFSESSTDSLQYLTRIHYMSRSDGIWGEHEIDYVFILHKDVTIQPNLEEVSEIVYISKDKMDKFTKELKYPYTPWFKLISSNWLFAWWDNLQQLDRFKDNNIHRFQ